MRLLPVLLLALALSTAVLAAAPLRLVISGGSQETGELGEVVRGRPAETVIVDGFPTPVQLAAADVLLLVAADYTPALESHRAELEAFAARGGGLVAIHGAAGAGSPEWLKPLLGGTWAEGKSQRFLNRGMLYVATDQHPIVAGASAFDLNDETAYDLDIDPAVKVLASEFTPKVAGAREKKRETAEKNARPDRANIFDLQPQLWAFEDKTHRAFVALPGTKETLTHPSYRTFLLRGIAWVAHRANPDELVTPEELAALRYPPGGPETPEATVKQFRLHPDFQASVVAAEPLINKPIAVQWDAKGRLWVAETPEYPNGRRPAVAEPWKETGVLDPTPDRPARDRISILSDPDAAGRFTKKTVFYEGLELVTGFCLYRDGVIALHEPDIVFIHGEGANRKAEPLYRGFKPGDTHFVGNHFIAAPDGWIYADMGGSANVTSPDGGRKLAAITAGLFRFRPDGSAIEQVSSKNGNGFGAEVTSDGELFFGQATSGNPIQHVALPEKTLALGKVGSEGGAHSVIEQRKVLRQPLPDRVPLMQIDMVGGYSAACSSLVYEGGAWPAAWERALFCTEPILNIIHHEALRPAGATFKGEMVRTDAEFLASPDYWFRPVEVTCGPDGALYILDFYNPVIAHSDSRGPLHSRSGASVRPDREHYFGRIYRVQHREATVLPPVDLTALAPTDLAQALTNPNRVVRNNALSLLVEKGGTEIIAALQPMARGEKFVPARILALWGLQRLGALPLETWKAALADGDSAVRKTAALIAEDAGGAPVQSELAAGLRDPDPRTRIAMLRGLATTRLEPASAAALLALYPELTDDYTRSAAVAAAASSPEAVIEAALRVSDPGAVQTLVSNVAAHLAERDGVDSFAALLGPLAEAPATADELQRMVLAAAAHGRAKPRGALNLEPLRRLLTTGSPAVRKAALPLAVRWDEAGALKPEVQSLVASLLQQLPQAQISEAERAQTVASLMGANQASPEIRGAIRSLLLAPGTSENLKRATVATFGATDDPAAGTVLADVFGELPASVQQPAFDLLLTRAPWAEALLDAIESQKVKPANLGPANLFRLRSHPDAALARRASAVLNQFSQPSADKDKVIAQLLPAISQPGNAAHGRELFTATCAVCHRLGDLGKEVGPVLTGIGAHGPEELLVSIVDPNRQIDAGFELFNVETTDGQVQSGILVQENDARLILRSPAGDTEVPKSKIKSVVNTHRSLMPEGFEALGGENLRDILAFIRGSGARYRVLDLAPAFTADTRRGLYLSAAAVHDTLEFKRFGLVTVEGIPFNIVNPENSLQGGNVIVLRGGPPESFAHSLPRRVEVKVGVPVKAFAFLGGVAGWGASKADPEGRAIMKVTAQFADGREEETVLHNGVEFADYIRPIDIPGSRFAEDVVKNRQIRWFTVSVRGAGVVKALVLESVEGGAAATTVAITADLGADAHP